MQYKTVIEVVTEADSSLEACDIAGEYLRGHLDSGITMKCRTRRLLDPKLMKLFSIVLVLAALVSMGAILKYSARTQTTSGHTLFRTSSF